MRVRSSASASQATLAGVAAMCLLASCIGGCGEDSDGAEDEAAAPQATESAAGTDAGMPDLAGASLIEAQDQLLALGLLNLKYAYERSGGPPGTVIGQSPAAGEALAPDQRVKITVVEAKVGDPCDENQLAAAELGGSLTDCDPVEEQVVGHGGKCVGKRRSGLLGNLECDPSRVCGGYVQWTARGKREPCELGKPVPSPGIVPPPTQVGDPCAPGEPLPAHLKCE